MTTSNHVADNGVVHIINGVMMPPNGTFVDIISADPEFSTLKAAVETAGIAEALNGNWSSCFLIKYCKTCRCVLLSPCESVCPLEKMFKTLETHEIF